MANIIINLTDQYVAKPSQRFTFKDISMPLTDTFDANFDLNAIRQSIKNIFSWKKGQRILDPLFGNALESFVYETINDLDIDNMKLAIDRMLKYEPRMIVTAIDVDQSNTDAIDRNEINISITYDIPQLSIKGINDSLILI